MQLFLSHFVLVWGLQGNSRGERVVCIAASGPRCSHDKRLLHPCLANGWEEDLRVKVMISGWGHKDRDGKGERVGTSRVAACRHLQIKWWVYEREKIPAVTCTGVCLLLGVE